MIFCHTLFERLAPSVSMSLTASSTTAFQTGDGVDDPGPIQLSDMSSAFGRGHWPTTND